MTIPRLMGMKRYWEHTPPVHISLARLCAAYLETPTTADTAQPWNPNEHDDILAAIMG